MTRRIRVGVIGCGTIAQVMHLPFLRELADRFEIVALCDLSPTVLEAVGETYRVDHRFTRWQDMLSLPLDAVMVLTSGNHAPAAVAAAREGMHVFVEKPMCLSVGEGQEMIETAGHAGVRLMVGYMKRYDPAYERLAIELRERPDLRLVRISTLESPIAPYVAHYPLASAADVPLDEIRLLRADDDRRVKESIGSVGPHLAHAYRRVLLDSLVHEINAIRGLLGEPDRLESVHIWNEGMTFVLSFGSARCVLQWVDLPGIARYDQELAFYAPEWRAALQFPSPFLRNAPPQLRWEEGASGTTQSWRTVETVSYESGFKRELIEFHECIEEGREPRTGGADSLRDIALCESIIATAVSGQPCVEPTRLPESGAKGPGGRA